MSTKVSSVLESVKERSDELHKALVLLSNNKGTDGKTLAKNTVSTTRHHLKRDQRALALIADLATALHSANVDEVKLSEAALQGLNQMCYPEAGGSRVSVKEGDSILALMQEYTDVKDLKAKLEKAATKLGLSLNFKTGKVVKA